MLISVPAQAGILFDVVVQTGDLIEGIEVRDLNGSPSLNDHGTVAFLSRIPGDDGREGLFTQHEFLVTRGDVLGGRVLTNLRSDLTINNHGTIVFVSRYDAGGGTEGVGIFTQDSLIADDGIVINGKTLTIPQSQHPAINDLGEIIFIGDFVGGSGVFTPTQEVVSDGDTVGTVTIDQIQKSASINNSGQIAFQGELDSPHVEGVMTLDGLIAELGPVDDKTVTDLNEIPSINNLGQVAWLGEIGSSTSRGVFIDQTFVAGPGSVLSGKTLTNVLRENPSLNDFGMVAFIADFGGNTGLFTQEGLIVAVGNVIEGKIIAALQGAPSINNEGEIAFFAQFTDGSEALIFARIFIPEPGTLLMSLMAASGFIFRRRRRGAIEL